MSDQEVEVEATLADFPIPQNADIQEMLVLLEEQIGNLTVQLCAERALKVRLQEILAAAQAEIRDLRQSRRLQPVPTPPD